MNRQKINCLHSENIPAGEFVVDVQGNRQIGAILGTCVAIILIDRHAKVGGLYHAILPEPPSNSPLHSEDATYASHGMPNFIEAMHKAGARTEHMEAVIAGGALLGAIVRNEPILDFGGKTVEVVKRTLAGSGIRIAHAETGGYFGYHACLNLDSFESSIESVAHIDSLKEDTEELVNKEIVLQAVDNIQPIPQVTIKVMGMLSDEDYSVREVSNLVSTDQVLTARVLRICNSALYSPKRQISTVDHAFTYIGEKRFLQILLAMSIEPYFNAIPTNGYSLRKGGMYHHALYTARVAELLSMSLDNEDPSIAYTAGLLHDIGKVVLDQFITRQYKRFLQKVMLRKMPVIDVETAWFGMNHQEIGLQLAQTWNLPKEFHCPIGFHHAPHECEPGSQLAYLIHIADLIVTKFKAGLEIERFSTKHLANYVRELNLSTGDLDRFVHSIHWKKLDQEVYMQM